MAPSVQGDRLINEETIAFACPATDKDGLFRFVAARAEKLGIADDAAALVADLHAREAEATTGLMDGFAIPHAKSAHVLSPAIFYVRCAAALPWETMDGSAVHNVFALLVPAANAGDLHLEMLSKLAVCLLDDDFKTMVTTAADASEMTQRICEALERTSL